jgi:hypothetical protein
MIILVPLGGVYTLNAQDSIPATPIQSFNETLRELNMSPLGDEFARSRKDNISIAISRVAKSLNSEDAVQFARTLTNELAGEKLDVEQYFGYLGNDQSKKLGQWTSNPGDIVSFKDKLSEVITESGGRFPLNASVAGKLSKVFVSSGEEFGGEPLALIEVSGTWIAVAIAQQIAIANQAVALDVALSLSELNPRLTAEICATLSATIPEMGGSFAEILGRLNPQLSGDLETIESEFVFDDPPEATEPSKGANEPGFTPIPFPEGGGGGGGRGQGRMYDS